MIQEKVKEQFIENTALRVLFFFDGSRRYAAAVKDWHLMEIELLEGSERYFHLKHELHIRLKDRKVFLYFPFPKPTGKAWANFPLLSTYHANAELKLDIYGQFLEKYGLKPYQLPLVKEYYKLISIPKVEKVLAKILDAGNFTKANIQRGLISYYLGLKSVSEQSHCLIQLMTLSLQGEELQKAINDIVSTNLESVVKDWTGKYFDDQLRSGLSQESVRVLVQKAKYNLIVGIVVNPLSIDTYRQRLEIKDAIVRNRLDSLWVDWKNAGNLEAINAVFDTIGDSIQADKLIGWYGVKYDYGYVTPSMSKAVLSNTLEQVLHQPEKVLESIISWINRASTDRLATYFETMKHLAATFSLLNEAATYRYNTLDEYVKMYSEKWYQVDYHYRKAIAYYTEGTTVEVIFEAKFEPVLVALHEKYDRYLIQLNFEWQNLLASENFDYSKISTPKQSDFYKDKLAHLEHKVAVIVSDGLRYEAAWELYDELLKSNDKVTVELTPMLASIPSYTKLGMANLLPNDGLTITPNKSKDDLDISINGISTEGLVNRRKILRQKQQDADTIQYDEVINYSQTKGRELFKASSLVYIYHNQIDTTGDSVKSESQTFNAVDKTIIDLKKLISKLRNSWNVYYIFITSDHGFLYNSQAISEATKEEMPKENAVWSKHNRFVLSDAPYELDAGYTFPLSNTTNAETPIQVSLPRAINRFKRQGSGKQYVHGGGSLQEVTVPTIFYFKKRDDSDLELVTVSLLNNSRLKITGNALKLQFIQNDSVNNNRKKTSWLIGIYTQNGDLISDEKTLVFDSTSTNATERMRSEVLKLSSTGSKSNFCYFRVFEWNSKNPTKLNPIVEYRLNNNTLIELDDF
jgi:uncharacterized protein (TIGR02687 family)